MNKENIKIETPTQLGDQRTQKQKIINFVFKSVTYIISSFLIFAGLESLNLSPIEGVFLLIAGIINLPYFFVKIKDFINKKFKFNYKPLINIIVVFSLFLLGISLTSSAQIEKRKVRAEQYAKKQELEKQKKEEENKIAEEEKRKQEERKIEDEKRKQIEEEEIEVKNKIAIATTANLDYDVESSLDSQDIEPTKQANLVIASFGNTTQNKKLFEVISVVDGDTIKVNELGTLRLIGIDTPETRDPRKPVQCFGVEASNRAKELLSGKKVYLEFDPANRIDKYGRTLAYVFREDGYFFNVEMLKDGFANSYTKFPHPKLDEFNKIAQEARENNRGLYSPSTCNGDSTQVAKKPEEVKENPTPIIPTTAPIVQTPAPTPKPTPTPKAPPSPIVTPAKPTQVAPPTPAPSVVFANCTEVRNAGRAPILRGQPGYSEKLDRDRDGIACEK